MPPCRLQGPPAGARPNEQLTQDDISRVPCCPEQREQLHRGRGQLTKVGTARAVSVDRCQPWQVGQLCMLAETDLPGTFGCAVESTHCCYCSCYSISGAAVWRLAAHGALHSCVWCWCVLTECCRAVLQEEISNFKFNGVDRFHAHDSISQSSSLQVRLADGTKVDCGHVSRYGSLTAAIVRDLVLEIAGQDGRTFISPAELQQVSCCSHHRQLS